MDWPVSIRLERATWAVGERLTGKVHFGPDERMAKVKGFRLKVGARVHGSGNIESVEVFNQYYTPPPPTGGELAFTVDLPEGGPVSWQGRYVKVDWAAEVSLDLPWAVDPKTSTPFIVQPIGADEPGDAWRGAR